ncbi:hypothetical protein [Candidatus Cyanaurora vandensis]|uniref:hypothetical protein n=1 Tax=Candidatus Cyanaurora vandensis TaxID=2714958 RepID=UPI00257AE7A0|nr:hypothetical protein [Candidatus Cyanaurora vandensis]
MERSRRRLAARDVSYFTQRLPRNQLWRLFLEFWQHLVYLDIETTGLRSAHDHITAIALYDGHQIKTCVWGCNLAQFPIDIHQ